MGPNLPNNLGPEPSPFPVLPNPKIIIGFENEFGSANIYLTLSYPNPISRIFPSGAFNLWKIGAHPWFESFKPEDDVINIETGRNDNKKTLITLIISISLFSLLFWSF